MKIEETRVVTQAPVDAETHYLEPGDVCVADFKTRPKELEPKVFGVVVRSASNTDKIVLVKFGTDPIRDFARTDLRWTGEID